jgi:ADP-heptose:LPS heptosyltransferase
MGLGGYLAWTATAREIVEAGLAEKVLPCEIYGTDSRSFDIKIIESDVWIGNPYITVDYTEYQSGRVALLQLNNPEANYCKNDTPQKAFHRWDKHIIEQMCEFYKIPNPSLKCDLFFTDREQQKVKTIISKLGTRFVTIEPNSKTNYTANRAYPFGKWQSIVNELAPDIQIVQIGRPGAKTLNNVVDMTGETSFREAALLIGESELFLSTEGGLTHAATATSTPALTVLTGYQKESMVAYPQNINVNIASHGPCGLKVECPECRRDAENHDWGEIVKTAKSRLCL